MQGRSVIVSAKRTPIGAFQGHLSSLSASDLAAICIKEILGQVGIQPDQINEVMSGTSANPASNIKKWMPRFSRIINDQ